MDINTCFETTIHYHVVALYSHLIPAAIAVFMSVFILCKSTSLLVKLFSFFTASFALWLLGDVVIWTSSNYNLVSLLWAPLDYINILFYLLGAYFFAVLVRGKDIHYTIKILIIAFVLPSWWITVTNQSITMFDQTFCEALNNEFLTSYKFFIEYIVIAFIMSYAFFEGRKKMGIEKKKIVTVAVALILFFVTFSVTEHISSITGVYEINLYSLFVLPIFLLMIVYAISDLEVFKIRLLGFQVLPYMLVIMISSQFFFLEDSTYKLLTVITLILSLGFAWLFLRSGKRELEAHNSVEALAGKLSQANVQLQEADRQKDELLGIVAHQLAKPITAIRWDLESLLDGDMGTLNPQQQEEAKTMKAQAVNLADLVSMILDVSRIQLGKMHLEAQPLDLNQLFTEMLDTIEPAIQQKKLVFTKNMPTVLPTALLDKRYTRMTIENLLTNAVKYTPDGGQVTLDIKIEKEVMRLSIADTGVGIPKADQGKIFGKMYRATNVRNAMSGNGFGLYVAKGAIEAQGGTLRFTSEEGKGTTFLMELPLKKATFPLAKK